MGYVRIMGMVCVVLMVGCPGRLGDEFTTDASPTPDAGADSALDANMPPPSLCTLPSPAQVVADKCATSGCHNGTYPPDLRPANFENLAGQAVVRSGCADEVQIDSANPENSFVYKVVVSSELCSGQQMPLSPPGQLDPDPDTDAALKDCLLDWVTEVAEGGAQ